MAQTAANTKVHTIHFSYDEDDSCALTTLINDVRFHIIVEPKELQKSHEKPLYYEYLDKISALREAEEREEERAEEQQVRVPRSTNKNKNREGSESSDGKDSGIDVTADDNDDEYADEEAGEDEDQDSGSAGLELRNWILASMADITAASAPPNREPEESTLYEWYHGPTYFYSLQIANGELSPKPLKTTPELKGKIEALIPRMKLPKYIQNFKLPWHNAHDLTVHSEVSMPPPAHPGQVVHKTTGSTYFFKPVVPDQPDSIKREISILRKLEKLDLDIKFPHLLGFVSYGSSKTQAMGLLLQNISHPTPLTKLLRSSIDADTRVEWSRKSEKYVRALHDNGIVWGDAKADNFMVDAESELWIIDFGGSYTEGWVDPEISETVEGDDMGLEKIRAALSDPERNTVDLGGGGDDEEGEAGLEGSSGGAKETASTLFVTEKSAGEEVTREQKRKRAEDEVGDGVLEADGNETPIKRKKNDSSA